MTDRERIQRIFSGEPEQMNELIEEYIRTSFNICIPKQGTGECGTMIVPEETFLRVDPLSEPYMW